MLDLERRRDALPHSARARELFDELAASGTQRAAPRYAAYATVLDRRARVALAELPDPATLARPIVERCAEDAEAWFLLSQAHADLATAGVDPAHADAAVDTLRRAIDLGFDRGDRVDTTAVFDGVRSRPDFGVQRARLDG